MLRSGKLIGEFEYFAVAVPVLDNKFVFEVRSPFVKQPGEISFQVVKLKLVKNRTQPLVANWKKNLV